MAAADDRSSAQDPERYGAGPCLPELAGMVLLGALHVVAELAISGTVAAAYNVAASLIVILYLLWRLRGTPGVLRVWGMRTDNLRTALPAQLGFASVGAATLLGVGMLTGGLPLPATFWLTLALYPIWATAQQFALQNLIARNLVGLVPGRLAVALIASALFAVAHYPNLELVVLTFVAGIFLTLIYRRFPNLWAVGIAHAILGSLAVHIVLGEDPGAIVLRYLSGG